MKLTVKHMKMSKAEKSKNSRSSQGASKKYCVGSQNKSCATTQKENKADEALHRSQSIEVKEVSKGKY